MVCFFVLFFSFHFIEFQHYFWWRPWNIYFHVYAFCFAFFVYTILVVASFFTFPNRRRSEKHYTTWAEVDKCVQRKQWENEIGTTNKAMQADAYYVERPATTKQYLQKQNQNPYKSIHIHSTTCVQCTSACSSLFTFSLWTREEEEEKNPHTHSHARVRSLTHSLRNSHGKM